MIDILQAACTHKIIAILRGVTSEEILPTAEALYKGGIRLLEVTFDHSGDLYSAPKAIRMLQEKLEGKMLFGAGTVLTSREVNMAYEAGAKYIITPNTDASVIRRAKELGLVVMPGAMTPTEVVQAYSLGADIVKIFPSGDLGPGYIKALRGPLNHIPMAAVGGITPKNIRAFLDAGACCAGVGGGLADLKAIRRGDFDALTKAAEEFISAAERRNTL